MPGMLWTCSLADSSTGVVMTVNQKFRTFISYHFLGSVSFNNLMVIFIKAKSSQAVSGHSATCSSKSLFPFGMIWYIG